MHPGSLLPLTPTLSASTGAREQDHTPEMTDFNTQVRNYLIDLQARIIQAIEDVDGQAKAVRDEWRKAPGSERAGRLEGLTEHRRVADDVVGDALDPVAYARVAERAIDPEVAAARGRVVGQGEAVTPAEAGLDRGDRHVAAAAATSTEAGRAAGDQHESGGRERT